MLTDQYELRIPTDKMKLSLREFTISVYLYGVSKEQKK